ncbi:hypothetical protein [Halobacillus seohaensis]
MKSRTEPFYENRGCCVILSGSIDITDTSYFNSNGRTADLE